MGRQFQYVGLSRVISKLYRDLGLEEISETDVIEWSGEALEAIGTIGLYEEAVAFTTVENYQTDLPRIFHSIIQMVRNNDYEEEVCAADIIGGDTVNPLEGEDALVPVALDCNGTPLSDYDLAYFRPYFDLQYEYSGWMGNAIYKKYSPVRLSNHSFFSSEIAKEDTGLYSAITDEYSISNNKILTSFEKGAVAIAYYRPRLDEKGYPLIPDDYSVITAITMYITMKYMARLWYLGREGYRDKVIKAEADWHWYVKQASNKAFTLHGIDEHQNFLEQRHKLIPRKDNYHGFFGLLGRKQSKRFD